MNAKDHMAKIASMPCICCKLLSMEQSTGSEVHHIRAEREPRNDFLTIPLCEGCHRERLGVHGDKTYLRMLKMSEWGLLAEVIKELT
jgi:Recombination enhancement, RecA-dependent nuclease